MRRSLAIPLCSSKAVPCIRASRKKDFAATSTWAPEVRPLLDLEGLKAWKPGRTQGYELLDRAISRFGTVDAWLERVAG
jgi:hypothetical protein